MNLKEANKKLEQLENDEKYWMDELENIITLISIKGVDTSKELIKGGVPTNTIELYAEKEDELKIKETLKYIRKQKDNLVNWIDNQLKIMLKYGEVEAVIIQLKENEIILDSYTGKYRELTWEEIAQKVHWSKTFCRNVYRKYKKSICDTP